VLIVADVHGAFDALARVASRREPLLVLGDLLNVVDHRSYDGLLAEVAGREVVAEVMTLRAAGEENAAAARWRAFAAGREEEIRRHFETRVRAEYRAMATALRGAESYVTYGNVDRPRLLAEALPEGSRFVDGVAVEIEGSLVGFAGGGAATSAGAPGEVTEAAMAEKLASLGPVEILCTHVAPAVAPLSTDVVGGMRKESGAVLEYLLTFEPEVHYFGDIHQPQATRWRVGRTRCVNAGYFRATRRALRHG
jgi:Icc-related predicted phosphoesterase